MGRQESFDNDFWTDPEVEDLTPSATYLYIWSFTNKRCGLSGVYRCSMRSMLESKIEQDAIPAALDELAHRNFLYYEHRIVWVRSRVKRLNKRSPQVAKGIVSDLAHMPVEVPIVQAFLAEYGTDEVLAPLLERIGYLYRPNPSESGLQLSLAQANLAPVTDTVSIPIKVKDKVKVKVKDREGVEDNASGPSRPRPREAPPAPAAKRLEVEGRPVSDEELALAHQVLDANNGIAGQANTSVEWLRMIIRRVREHPEVTSERHVAAIAATYAKQFWRRDGGRWSLELVYRRGDLFEKALDAASSPPVKDRREENTARKLEWLTTGRREG